MAVVVVGFWEDDDDDELFFFSLFKFIKPWEKMHPDQPTKKTDNFYIAGFLCLICA